MKHIKLYENFLELNEYTTSSTHLRKLTFKSKLNFGKWPDLTIENLAKNQASYLRWIYFNASNIDFMDDVLSKIGIPDNVRIKKPGKDPELGKKYNKEYTPVNPIEDELHGYKKKQLVSQIEKGHGEDSAYTNFKFGKYAGGRSQSKTEIRKNPKKI